MAGWSEAKLSATLVKSDAELDNEHKKVFEENNSRDFITFIEQYILKLLTLLTRYSSTFDQRAQCWDLLDLQKYCD